MTGQNDHIVDSIIDEEMKKSYLAYAMSVLVGRALPDVNDGLKPVHRRILYAMRDLGLASNKQTRKSARIVGDVIGKYHPHGDTAVYESMVRLAQPFSMRYPLVHGQGNFGSIDGDSAAAMRYTEAKMTKLAEAMLEDIEKETVDFAPNFDEMESEPTVLPSKLPNLLLNGSTGIAVGMATNMAPHNLTEISDALIQLIDNPDIEDEALLASVSAPDFPTGGIIVGKSGVRSAYLKGRGRVILRARTHIEEGPRKSTIIITEIPYMVKKEDLLVNMAEAYKNKVIPDIALIRDESDKDGLRIVVELKQGAQKELVLNQLFKHTRLQGTFGIINLCLVNSIPKILTLKELLAEFVGHRERVITRRIEYLLRKAEEKAHLLLGLKKAVENLDEALKIIRGSSEGKIAREGLMTAFALDEKQAQAILDMRLQKLTGLERDSIVTEYNQIILSITEYKSILGDRTKVIAIIREEVIEIREKYGDARRTDIIDAEFDFDQEDLIEDETVVITITQGGFVKRVPVDTYRAQARGGRGIIGASTRKEDQVYDIFTAHSKAYVLCFSTTGQMYWLKAYKIPEAGRTATGRSIRNLLPLSEGEEITTFIPVNMFDEGLYLVMTTKNGVIKKTPLNAFAKPRTSGIRALQLDDGDELIGAKVSDGTKEIILATAHGLAARFREEDVRSMGRTAFGVRGIRLQEGDSVIGMILDDGTGTILTVTENGYGKRTPISDYRLINRGGKGVINIQTSDRNGNVVHIAAVSDEDNILLMSQNGIVIRTRADQISVIGRNTQGVRLMRLGEGDVVQSVAKVFQEDGEGDDETSSDNISEESEKAVEEKKEEE